MKAAIPGNPPPAGLCAKCLNVRVVQAQRGSIFYRCGLSAVDNVFPRYPRLPVLECIGYEVHQGKTPPASASF